MNRTSLLLAIAALLTAAACQPKELNELIVRGVVEGARTPTARLGEHSADIDADGRFMFHLAPAGDAYLVLDIGERLPMYLGPGDQVELYARADSLFETLQLRGANAHINGYLIEAKRIANAIDFAPLLRMPQAAFVDTTVALQAEFEARLAAFIEDHHATDLEFVRRDREGLRYAWARVRQQHRDFDGTLLVPADSVFVDRFDVELHPAMFEALARITGVAPTETKSAALD